MKSNQNLAILFWHRKSKADTKGLAPIICRITIDAMDAEFSTALKVHADHWDTDAKKVRTASEAKTINSAISRIQTSLETHFIVLKTQHEFVTPIMLRNAYRNLPADHRKGSPKLNPETVPTLLEVAELQVSEFSEMVDKKLRSKETLKQWKATKKKLTEFVRYAFKSKDIALVEIEYVFAQKFYNYLTLKRNPALKEAAAMKQVKNVKQILNLAETNSWLPKNPIDKFKCGAEEPEILPLELFEIEQIWHKKLTIDRLIKVRDAFVFQCFTGFAYQDIYGLTPEHIIKVGLNKERWLVKERGKTKVTELVPILPIVEEIIEKYRHDPYCVIHNRLIPVNSNVRYNCYLKELSDLCSLGRPLNTHLARHTFADLMLNVLDFPLEDVSKMLGHKNIRTTQRYARVKKKRISDRMNQIKNILFNEAGQLKETVG